MNLRYLLGAIPAIPMLPLLYFHGKKIRATVPKLPEATGRSGRVKGAGGKMLHLLLLGESTVAGVGAGTHDEGFAGTFARELSARLGNSVAWEVCAKSGYTARDVTGKLLPRVAGRHFDLIVAGLGGNDAFRLNTPWGWRSDMESLLAALHSQFPGTPVFFLNMPPVKDFPAFTAPIRFVIGNLVEIFGSELSRLTKNYPDVYFNDQTIRLKEWATKLGMEADAAPFFSDGVHPSLFTYQIWAKDFAGFVAVKVAGRMREVEKSR